MAHEFSINITDKSESYNTLDSSTKFYKESEIAENGQVIADIDETGENKNRLQLY